MPIDCNEEKIIIPIEYTDEANPEIFYHLRYHFTPEFGPTLSFSEDGENFVGYPAKACLEAILYLLKKGVLKAPQGVSVPSTGRPAAATPSSTLPLPNIAGSGSAGRPAVTASAGPIPVPTITGGKKPAAKKEEETEAPEPLIVEGEMVQSFSPDEEEGITTLPPEEEGEVEMEPVDDVAAAIAGGTADEAEEPEEEKEEEIPETPEILKEDAKKMLQERLKATEKADTGIKKASFRPNHGIKE